VEALLKIQGLNFTNFLQSNAWEHFKLLCVDVQQSQN
jgi:hypothetical protein